MVGPGFANTDFALLKNTKVSERLSLQFRAELFNIFNHPNFNFPSTSVFNAGSFNPGSISTSYQATPNVTAGQITSLVGTSVTGSARQTQFSLKLLF